jgi:hypothetical protein
MASGRLSQARVVEYHYTNNRLHGFPKKDI